MAQPTLEERVAVLEQTVAQLMSQAHAEETKPDWRGAIGMFANDPVMQEIDEEGRRIRESDRQQAQL
jgi:hypothetical protein